MSKDLKRNRGLGHGTQRDCGLLAADAGIMFDRSWIFRPDPDFRDKAGLALDLYELRFEGKLLHPGELVISADERSQLQALGRRLDTELPGPGRPVRSEFEYRRGGTLAYLAAWDVHHARLFDRGEPTTGIEPFGRLVEQVMTTEPSLSAGRCSGSWTTAPPTPATPRSGGSRASGATRA